MPQHWLPALQKPVPQQVRPLGAQTVPQHFWLELQQELPQGLEHVVPELPAHQALAFFAAS